MSEQAFQEFKSIYESEFGTSNEEILRKMARDLLTLFAVVYRPLKESWVP